MPQYYTFSTPDSISGTLNLLVRQNEGIESDTERFSSLINIDEIYATYSSLLIAPPEGLSAARNLDRVTPELPEIDFIPITEKESDKQLAEADKLIKQPLQIIVRVIEKKRDKLITDRFDFLKEKKKKAKIAQQKLELREQFKKEFNKKQSNAINEEYSKVMAEKELAVKDQYNLVLEPLVYASETESNGYDNFLLSYYTRIQFKTEIADIPEIVLINILYFTLIDYMDKFIIPYTELTEPFVKIFIWTFYYNIIIPLRQISRGPLYTKIDTLFQKVGAIKDTYTIKSDFKNIYVTLMTNYFSLIAALSKNILLLDINTNNPLIDTPLIRLLNDFSTIRTETKPKLLRDSLDFFCQVYADILQILIRRIKDEQKNKTLVPTLIISTKSAVRIEHYELIIAILTSKGLTKIQFTPSQYPSIETFKANYTTALNFFEKMYNINNPAATDTDIGKRAYWKSWNQGRFFESFERENIDLHYLEIILYAFMQMPTYGNNMKINESIHTYFDLAAIKQKRRDVRVAIGYCEIQVIDRKNEFLFTFNCLKIIHFFYLLNKYSKKILYKFLLINQSFYDIFDAICKCGSAELLSDVVEKLLEEEKTTYRNTIQYLVANVAKDPSNVASATAAPAAAGITTVSRNQLAKILAASGTTVASYKNAASASALGPKGSGPKAAAAPGSGPKAAAAPGAGPKAAAAPGSGPKAAAAPGAAAPGSAAAAPGAGPKRSKGGRRKVTKKLRRKVTKKVNVSKKTRTKRG